MVCNIDETGTRYLKLAIKWKINYILGCWIRILSGDGLHLWMLGALVHLTLFGVDTILKQLRYNWIPRDFTSNIQFFWFEFHLCGLRHRRDRKRYLKLVTKWKTTYILGCWLRILSGDGLHLWLLGALVDLTLFGVDTILKQLRYKLNIQRLYE